LEIASRIVAIPDYGFAIGPTRYEACVWIMLKLKTTVTQPA
jgi:hypothetical protein